MKNRYFRDFYRGRTVLVTGHTGFKGSWLCHVLRHFGANVVGIGLAPRTKEDIFVRTELGKYLVHHEFDVRELEQLHAVLHETSPEIVFHLAAQALVRESYDDPLQTITTNVTGTANMLEAIRHVSSVRAAIIVTTDKVYKNREWVYGYRENDALGGHDPYSASKAAADIVTQAYLASYFHPEQYGTKHKTLVAVARAGNVIGGGDWSPDRLVPDIMRSVFYGEGTVTLRNPAAVRPWEHVLEPITGYMQLACELAQGRSEWSGAWNFGPDLTAWQPVAAVTQRLLALLGKGMVQVVPDSAKHESGTLTLDVTKAYRLLGWRAKWNLEQTLRATAEWYAAVADDVTAAPSITTRQIETYFQEE